MIELINIIYIYYVYQHNRMHADVTCLQDDPKSKVACETVTKERERNGHVWSVSGLSQSSGDPLEAPA